MTSEERLKPSAQQMEDMANQIADDINNVGIDVDMVVGVSRGGLVPAVYLSHLLDRPLVPISYSSKEGKGDDKNHKNTVPEVSPGTVVLIVDDICDTGHTMRELHNIYVDMGAIVFTACLYYRQTQNNHTPVFHCVTLTKDDGWVVFPFEKSSS